VPSLFDALGGLTHSVVEYVTGKVLGEVEHDDP
jgi:hypothetical protein